MKKYWKEAQMEGDNDLSIPITAARRQNQTRLGLFKCSEGYSDLAPTSE